MIINNYAIESQFVNEFMEYTFLHPLNVGDQFVRLFIWGHELWLQDGKGDFNSGIIDLIATDNTGEVWLIEGKLNSNTEWNSKIWRNQISLYAKSLQTKTEQQIVLGVRRYISKQSKGTVFPSFLSEEITSLSHAFGLWGESIQKDYQYGLELYEKTMTKLSKGEIIQCVLSNEPSQEIWNNRPKDNVYACAYITFNKNNLDLVLEKNQATYFSGNDTKHWTHQTFDYYLKDKKSIKPTVSNIPLLLADSVVPTYEKIISFLKNLGWDGKYTANTKAFQFDLPTIYGVPIRVHIGWNVQIYKPRKSRLHWFRRRTARFRRSLEFFEKNC